MIKVGDRVRLLPMDRVERTLHNKVGTVHSMYESSEYFSSDGEKQWFAVVKLDCDVNGEFPVWMGWTDRHFPAWCFKRLSRLEQTLL